MKKKLKLFITSISAAAMLSVALTGCSQGVSNSGEKGEEVTIKFWTQSDPAYKKAAQSLIDKFEKENPSINVKLESFPNYALKVSTSFNTGNVPDVLEAYGSTTKMAKGGKILPIPDNVMTNEEIEKTFIESSLINRKYDGKYYGVPNEITMESPGLLINKDLVKKAGLTIPEAWIKNDGPANWSELVQFARKLTIIDNGVMKQSGLGVIGGQEEAMFLSLIWQYGGDYRDEQKKQVDFTTPEALKAVEFMKGLIKGDQRVNDIGFSKRLEGFVGGSIAMTIGAPWVAANLRSDVPDLNYQYFNLPPFVEESKPYYVTEGGWGYLVSSKTKHPKESWELVKYLLKKENQDYWVKAVGAITSRTEKGTVESYDPAVGSVEKAIAVSSKIVDNGREPGTFTGDTSQLMWAIIRQNLASILQGEVSANQGLKNMEEQAMQMIERNERK
ncbi:ABC transporter substrate-binding protein [Peribacillus muralis]|uniref:ABC transporter substrate-binding protein n=1 Tax=Peribacillus muralis TaxID=264697 RepID=UPI001F4EB50D|nr:ABC transporter substrate-binding protein [Peribacillus muralis]MCK1992956.1 ABC transporter substrate-binding protein [Peribacillus muralis]MCK2013511.1 ABC transporter substrate-binding protein [Peribacillus muralis]